MGKSRHSNLGPRIASAIFTADEKRRLQGNSATKKHPTKHCPTQTGSYNWLNQGKTETGWKRAQPSKDNQEDKITRGDLDPYRGRTLDKPVKRNQSMVKWKEPFPGLKDVPTGAHKKNRVKGS